MSKTVSVVTTVLNAAEGMRVLLDSLDTQTRTPDEVIVVDGGSTDGTRAIVQQAAILNQAIRLIHAPSLNIGQGRNLGIENATGEIIASTDSGCRLDPSWLASITAPFEDDRRADFVAGFYKIDPQTPLERVVGLTTMRGALDPVDPERFNPSARSMAFTKDLWQRAGGIPDFLAIDDTLFDAKIRTMNVRWVFAPDAIVHWRPRGTYRSLFAQFRFYGTSAGHTQMFAESTHWNLRNMVMVAILLAVSAFQPFVWLFVLAAWVYFFMATYHRKSRRVARAMGRRRAYAQAMMVHWMMTFGDALGYLKGTWQRWLDPERYIHGLTDYMGLPKPGSSRHQAVNVPPAASSQGAST